MSEFQLRLVAFCQWAAGVIAFAFLVVNFVDSYDLSRQPCNYYNNHTVKNIPARCLSHFLKGG